MPIYNRSGAKPDNPLQMSFIERLKAGRVVPIISGAGLADLTMGGHARLTQHLCEFMDYPLPDNDRLVEIARYYKVQNKLKDDDLKSAFLNFVKNFIYYMAEDEGADEDMLAEAEAQVDDLTVSEFGRLLGYPRFGKGPDDLLLLLANLPINVYLTTSPYEIIEDALRLAGKTPVSEICRWKESLDSIPPVITPTYRPCAEEPLVYHLHGRDNYPDSLVLTEDDHLEFLVNISQGAGNANADRVHGIVRQALFDDLILLGFSLSDWGFRSLYAGLIHSIDRQDEVQFDVYWGAVSGYGQELRQLLDK